MPTPVLFVGLKSMLDIVMLLMFSIALDCWCPRVEISVMRPESKERKRQSFIFIMMDYY